MISLRGRKKLKRAHLPTSIWVQSEKKYFDFRFILCRWNPHYRWLHPKTHAKNQGVILWAVLVIGLFLLYHSKLWPNNGSSWGIWSFICISSFFYRVLKLVLFFLVHPKTRKLYFGCNFINNNARSVVFCIRSSYSIVLLVKISLQT